MNENESAAEDTFLFAMGEFEASFPRGYRYAKNHMWAAPSPDQSAADDSKKCVWRFGLSAYAVRLLQDVYFLDWIVEPGTLLQHRKTIGSIESKKAESDLFSPIEGELLCINEAAMDEPSVINASPYQDGWLFEILGATTDEHLLASEAYADHLNEAWEVAQRTIKGQANH
ncbi:glycine cleavage system protein H [Rhodopirellula sp. JC740]|uniref:Glycine cleavage system protein H n=1 Tax=Rhodopirellula halodulae TaxID=2894198 RepID=A0ABS8ND39_9BACT|nr:glycine cleavage system protein H [Rhodopirellula sp. JC740]MCC9641319.1 glycine cleavage system protein H [Rhodopirellula sp. JC740]